MLSVTSNLMKHYDPDKVAIEIVAFGPGIELLRPENPNRKMVESLVAQGAQIDICLNTVDTLERDTGKRPDYHRCCDTGPGRRCANSVSDRKWLYAGQAVIVYSPSLRASEATKQGASNPFLPARRMDCFAPLAMTRE